ncbi:MAG: hypothetical protein E7049_10785 [Lentisphaerae bacterium]|jgi:hypothetical protein|nr:hypothetical protein [Lentisphaerota bacterium]
MGFGFVFLAFNQFIHGGNHVLLTFDEEELVRIHDELGDAVLLEEFNKLRPGFAFSGFAIIGKSMSNVVLGQP